MKKNLGLWAILLTALLILPGIAAPFSDSSPQEKHPLESVPEIMAWKAIRPAAISPDGAWFGYRLAPSEGDGEVIFRQTQGTQEFRFPDGEAALYASTGRIAFSEDSHWAAFTVLSKADAAKKLKKDKKSVHNQAALINLAIGEKIEITEIKSFAFSGENPGWVVFHKYVPENQEKEKTKWEGSDLILYDLQTSKELNLGNVSEYAFDKAGRWLAWTVDAQGQSGNGLQIRDMESGVIRTLDSGKAVYKQVSWTEKGDGLAVLKGTEDEEYENKRFSVLGFKDLKSAHPSSLDYTPQDDSAFPTDMTVSPNRPPQWTEDLEGLLFGIHQLKKKEKHETAQDEPESKPREHSDEKTADEDDIDKEDLPGLVIWHWKDKRLQSMQQVQEKRDKDFSYLCIYRCRENKFIRLADDNLRDVTAAPKQRWAIGIDKGAYEWKGNLDGRRYQDIYVIDLKTGTRRPAIKECRWFYGPSPDGSHFLYYRDGHFHVFEMAGGKSVNITKDLPTSFVNAEDDHNVIKPPALSLGWVKDGVSVLLSDNWDVWNVPVRGGKAVNLTVNGKSEQIRYRRRFKLHPDEKGIDLKSPVFFEAYMEWTKKSGIVRCEGGRPGVKRLLWDDALFSLLKAKKSDIYVYSRQTDRDYGDFYVTDGMLKKGRRLTEANPQQNQYLWSAGARLVDYSSDKGDKLQAALFLPAGYEAGKSYPTIVYIYEKLSQRLNAYDAPRAYSFNKSVYTSRGYAVLMPDITYQINDPGMSAVWCVLPALKAAIDTGIVDPDRVGLHGHSWGGYQTAFLVTQTKMFRAAVAGAPLTNMLSMYNSIYWNTGSANQPIFESSQGRFKGGYWDNLEAYTRNSPVYFAERVDTPLMILHNDKDGAVDWNQGIEYFNTLRRLGKPVVMLQYKGENHGLRIPANRKDYGIRMREFFDHHLRNLPAPEWLSEGVSHLDHEKHIKDRTRKILEIPPLEN